MVQTCGGTTLRRTAEFCVFRTISKYVIEKINMCIHLITNLQQKKCVCFFFSYKTEEVDEFDEPKVPAANNKNVDPLVTASHAIFHTEDKKSAPAAVVGFQFRHKNLFEIFKNMSGNVSINLNLTARCDLVCVCLLINFQKIKIFSLVYGRAMRENLLHIRRFGMLGT